MGEIWRIWGNIITMCIYPLMLGIISYILMATHLQEEQKQNVKDLQTLITKKEMESIIKYRAIDGREFEDISNCIDEQFREWGQPYFAVNPDKGKQICINN